MGGVRVFTGTSMLTSLYSAETGAMSFEDGIMRRRCFLPNGLISFRSEAQPRPARQAVLPLTRHQNIRKAAHVPGNAVSG